MALVLRQTNARFESVAAEISGVVRDMPACNSLTVVLQEFDRLQQEFAAVSDVLDHCTRHGDGTVRRSVDAVAAVTVSGVRDRLAEYLSGMPQEPLASDAGDVEF